MYNLSMDNSRGIYRLRKIRRNALASVAGRFGNLRLTPGGTAGGSRKIAVESDSSFETPGNHRSDFLEAFQHERHVSGTDLMSVTNFVALKNMRHTLLESIEVPSKGYMGMSGILTVTIHAWRACRAAPSTR